MVGTQFLAEAGKLDEIWRLYVQFGKVGGVAHALRDGFCKWTSGNNITAEMAHNRVRIVEFK
jgi:hypothetical protein